MRPRPFKLRFSRYGSHGSVLTVRFSRFEHGSLRFGSLRLASHGSVLTVRFTRFGSHGSVRTVWFTRVEMKSKIANRKSVDCEFEIYCFLHASSVGWDKIIKTRHDPLRPARTRYDPLRYCPLRPATTRYDPPRPAEGACLCV